MRSFIKTIKILNNLFKERGGYAKSYFHVYFDKDNYKPYIRYKINTNHHIDYEIPPIYIDGYLNTNISEYFFILYWKSPYSSRSFDQKIIDTIEFPDELLRYHKTKILK